VKALVFERRPLRFAGARLASALAGSGAGARIGPLKLIDADPPRPPGEDFVSVRPLLAGICGSDLALLDGASSRYFEPLVSFPFVPGHEVVGIAEHRGVAERVVVEPVLGCEPRGLPPCPACATGKRGRCQRIEAGRLEPGLQIGYCASTGGGWSEAGLVAHRSQLYTVPDDLSDEAAVLVEPAACACHAVLRGNMPGGARVAVLGAGTLGLLVAAACRQLGDPGALLVGAKYEHQRDLARRLGADAAVVPSELGRAVRRHTRGFVAGRRFAEGADIVFDCVGTSESITDALAMVRPGGAVVLVGMPARVALDLAPLWHREVALVGAYAYGTERIEHPERAERPTFELALELVAEAKAEQFVSAAYPLDDYEAAIAHAGQAGQRGAIKVVFDLRDHARRDRPRARRQATLAKTTSSTRTQTRRP
jgi:threonine dehydrogenase-like Zn-dependent dehydrogenase